MTGNSHFSLCHLAQQKCSQINKESTSHDVMSWHLSTVIDLQFEGVSKSANLLMKLKTSVCYSLIHKKQLGVNLVLHLVWSKVVLGSPISLLSSTCKVCQPHTSHIQDQGCSKSASSLKYLEKGERRKYLQSYMGVIWHHSLILKH